jgi:hypothetical protein
MMILARWIKHAFDVMVPHDADPGEHRRPAMFCNQQQRFHRGLPWLGIVFCFDVARSVAERDERFSARSSIGSKNR